MEGGRRRRLSAVPARRLLVSRAHIAWPVAVFGVCSAPATHSHPHCLSLVLILRSPGAGRAWPLPGYWSVLPTTEAKQDIISEHRFRVLWLRI